MTISPSRQCSRTKGEIKRGPSTKGEPAVKVGEGKNLKSETQDGLSLSFQKLGIEQAVKLGG